LHPTTTYSFGDMALVAFPFTHQVGTRKHPAAVVSSQAYHRQRLDVILMAVTSQVRQPSGFGWCTPYYPFLSPFVAKINPSPFLGK